jgi:hypothetical protein
MSRLPNLNATLVSGFCSALTATEPGRASPAGITLTSLLHMPPHHHHDRTACVRHISEISRTMNCGCNAEKIYLGNKVEQKREQLKK